jgi:hypothetical protein
LEVSVVMMIYDNPLGVSAVNLLVAFYDIQEDYNQDELRTSNVH